MDQTRPRAGLETRCPAFGVYASCPKLFLGRLVGPYAYVYGSCPCRQNQRQMTSQGAHADPCPPPKEPTVSIRTGTRSNGRRWPGLMNHVDGRSSQSHLSMKVMGCSPSRRDLESRLPLPDRWNPTSASVPESRNPFKILEVQLCRGSSN
ncbi:hypothetical protein DPX16_3083 [Anabarilius grahami]|uniref:Uncharacterized protein n=1 Tax=Anabarilius grahami TaxID=495550 RepID=A0A3N0XIW4_ANAGA|nr:hypothetical protein DPX16_3083 [Anabarilius grahami]